MSVQCGVCGQPAGSNAACSTCIYTQTVLTAWTQRRPTLGVLGQGVQVLEESPPPHRPRPWWWRFWERGR